MKKYLIVLLILFSFASYGQTVRVLVGLDANSRPGFLYRDTVYSLSNTANQYFTGFGTWGNFFDTARAAFSLTTTGTSGAATYTQATGVFNIPVYGAGTGTVTSFSAGTLSPLFTTSVATATTTPALTFTLSTAAAHTFLGNSTGSTAVPTYVKVDLAADVTGTLPIANGGTNITNYTTGDILYASATNVLSKLPIGTTRQKLGVVGGVPAWMDSTAVSGASGWLLTGNASTDTAVNFIGTTDNPQTKPQLRFRVFNVFSGIIDSTGSNVGRTFFGYGSGSNTVGQTGNYGSTGFGFHALRSEAGQLGGAGNVAMGSNAGTLIVGSFGNTLIGSNAGRAIVTTGTYNTVVGANLSSFTGGSNVLVGALVAPNATTMQEATIVGYNAVGSGIVTSAGSRLTAIGENSMNSHTSGTETTGLGYSSGLSNTSGARNLYLGARAGRENSTLSDRIFINTEARGSLTGDTTGSPFYANQSTIVGNQIVTLNGRTGINQTQPPTYAALEVKQVDSAKGVLFPRLTTVQKTAIVTIIGGGSVTAVGSGYVTGSYTNVPLTGGTGANATANIIISAGGAVSSVTIILQGSQYTSGDVLSASNANLGGSGSGFTWTVSSVVAVQKGLMVYDSTLNVDNTWDATRWTSGAKFLSNTATLDFASLVAIGCEDLTITVTGAADGDPVVLGVPNGSVVANSSYSAWVSSANTVSVRFCALVSGDPASGTFKVTVSK